MGNKTLFNIGLINNTPHNVEAYPVNNSNKVLLLGSGDTGKTYANLTLVQGNQLFISTLRWFRVSLTAQKKQHGFVKSFFET
jgi:hypothetical protein